MLNWANQFNISCFLDNHQYNISPHSVECLLAVGAASEIKSSYGNSFSELRRFSEKNAEWLFGHFAYDLKNEIENLSSDHYDGIGFPDLYFFVPEIIIKLELEKVSIGCLTEEPSSIFNQIQNASPLRTQAFSEDISINKRISRSAYLEIISQLQSHIHRGDCYEINFCQEFFADGVSLDPILVYQSLAQFSPNPFSAYYRVNDQFLMCASPERYLKKQGSYLLSQPIKGTIERNEELWFDNLNKDSLLNSLKDRTENVMIVDLVRNDLSRVCKEGSVRVKELFAVYPFPQVYQMISTIVGELKDDADWLDSIHCSFPMGSMTGAPKKRVMQLIEEYECTRRGIFSGAVGYVTPERDFDFNVVIRSMMYNAHSKYLSFQAGSAITFQSDPLIEYEECLLKVEAIKKVLTRSAGQHFQRRY
jgi:para-aminobenzoate synthetase component 1